MVYGGFVGGEVECLLHLFLLLGARSKKKYYGTGSDHKDETFDLFQNLGSPIFFFCKSNIENNYFFNFCA